MTDMERRKLTPNGREGHIDGAKRHSTPVDELGDDTLLPRLFDTETLAEHLRVPARHVRRLVAERRVPYLKWGRLVRFDPAEIADWLDRARTGAVSSARQP